MMALSQLDEELCCVLCSFLNSLCILCRYLDLGRQGKIWKVKWKVRNLWIVDCLTNHVRTHMGGIGWVWNEKQIDAKQQTKKATESIARKPGRAGQRPCMPATEIRHP